MAHAPRPFLMFQDANAEAALRFYASVFADARIEQLDRYGAGEDGPEGTLRRGALTIAGQTILFYDSGVKHAFGFTPAISFFIACADAAELRGLAAALGEGGQDLMPIGNYGFSQLFAWVGDKYGVSWQLNLE